MYRLTYLTEWLWSRKLYDMKKKYHERHVNSKWYNHYKKIVETNELYCNICGNSLKDCIGKEIITSNRSGTTTWNHIECAIQKNIIFKNREGVIQN